MLPQEVGVVGVLRHCVFCGECELRGTAFATTAKSVLLLSLSTVPPPLRTAIDELLSTGVAAVSKQVAAPQPTRSTFGLLQGPVAALLRSAILPFVALMLFAVACGTARSGVT